MVRRKQADSERIDDLLLGILRDDSRASNTRIATKLGLTESAVRRRIKNTLPATGVDIPGMVIDYLISAQKR